MAHAFRTPGAAVMTIFRRALAACLLAAPLLAHAVPPTGEDGIADLARRGTEGLPALSSHEPVYFILGRRDDTTARRADG